MTKNIKAVDFERSLKRLEKIVQEYRIDGLVLHSDRSCKSYSMGQYDLKRLLTERLGIKSVIIESDMTDFRVYSDKQVRSNLDAFFEALEN